MTTARVFPEMASYKLCSMLSAVGSGQGKFQVVIFEAAECGAVADCFDARIIAMTCDQYLVTRVQREDFEQGIDALGSVSNEGHPLRLSADKGRQALTRLLNEVGVGAHHELDGVALNLHLPICVDSGG